MRRFLALLAACLLLTSCFSLTMVSGKGKIDLPTSSAGDFSPEFPPADTVLPEEESSAPDESTALESASSALFEEEISSSAGSLENTESSAASESQSVSQALPSSEPSSVSSSEPSSAPTVGTDSSYGEVRAVWISYLEFLSHARNVSKTEFTSWISDTFENAADYGLNTVYVQVRPFGDALYESDIFPWSYVLTGSEGVSPGYDPLEIMVDAAKEKGLRIEAWLNPYRVRALASSREISDDNPALAAINSGRDIAKEYGGGIFYNPASSKARTLIADGVREILENYDVDGIHFDDYFYPTTDTSFDSSEYSEYTSSGGKLSLAEWRRNNVTLLIKEVSAVIKETDPNASFGISPQARMDINYSTQYADIEAWAEAGYMDYVCPQIYFGFEHDSYPFDRLADEWAELVSETDVELYIGLAVYKCGVSDNYAGSGSGEWLNNDDIIAKMVRYTRKLSGCGGFVLYRYDSLFEPESSVKSAVRAERSNLSAIL